MFGTHIDRHTTPTTIVVPFAQFLDDLVRLSVPDKSVRTAWFFL